MKELVTKSIMLLSLGLLCLGGLPALAADPETGIRRWQDNAGKAAFDSLTWSRAGAQRRIDTLVAGTLNDTTTSVIDLTGADFVAVKILTRSLNDQANYKLYFRVSPDQGSWDELTTVFTIANTKGNAVGAVAENTGRDTTTFILYNRDAAKDTVTAVDNPSHTGTINARVVTVSGKDMRQLRANRYLQLRIDPGAAAGDSITVKALLTRVWPLNPSY